LVGGSAFLLSILLFNILKNNMPFFSKYLGLASIIGDVSGLMYGFYINKNWTYSKQKRDGEKYFFKYILLYVTTILINYILLKTFLWFLVKNNVFNQNISENITENIAKILATIITTVLNFVGTNYVIFSHSDDDKE